MNNLSREELKSAYEVAAKELMKCPTPWEDWETIWETVEIELSTALLTVGVDLDKTDDEPIFALRGANGETLELNNFANDENIYMLFFYNGTQHTRLCFKAKGTTNERAKEYDRTRDEDFDEEEEYDIDTDRHCELSAVWVEQEELLGLCKGRHELPVDKYIFEDAIEDPTDMSYMEEVVEEALSSIENPRIGLYVTGLTVALVAVLNVATRLGKFVTLYHFDSKKNTYFCQEAILGKYQENDIEEDEEE